MLVYLVQRMWVIIRDERNFDIPNKNEKYETQAIPKPVKTRSVLRPSKNLFFYLRRLELL